MENTEITKNSLLTYFYQLDNKVNLLEGDEFYCEKTDRWVSKQTTNEYKEALKEAQFVYRLLNDLAIDPYSDESLNFKKTLTF